MQNISNFLIANPWLNLIFLILAILSIIVSIILYLRSRKEKILVYTTRRFNLIHNSVLRIPGLSIKYEDNNINTLTLTKIAFWNKGKGTINSTDMAPLDKLTIFPKEDVKILSASIAFQSRNSNNLNLEKLENKVIVNFDYIDFNQGIIIDLYHTGQGGDSIILKGTVKGGRELSVGEISKDYLFDKIAILLLRICPRPKNKLYKLIIYRVYTVIVAIILAAPAMIILPIDKYYRMANKLPDEFDLSFYKME